MKINSAKSFYKVPDDEVQRMIKDLISERDITVIRTGDTVVLRSGNCIVIAKVVGYVNNPHKG